MLTKELCRCIKNNMTLPIVVMTSCLFMNAGSLLAQSTSRDAIKNYLEKSDSLRFINNEESLIYNLKALQKALLDNEREVYLEAIFQRSEQYLTYNQYDSAKFYALECIVKGQKAGNAEYIGKGYNQVGSIYAKRGDEGEGLKYYLNALAISRKANHDGGIGISYFKIGNYYLKESLYDRAVDNYEKALVKFKKVDRKKQICGTLTNLGTVYLEKNELDKALKYYAESHSYATNNNLEKRLPWIELNLGKIYIRNKKFSKADSILQVSHLHAVKYANSKTQCKSLAYLAILNIELQNPKAGLNLYFEALELSKQYQLKDTELFLYKKMAEYFGKTTDYEHGYYYQEKYLQLNDSLNNVEKVKQIAILRERFEAKGREEKIVLLNQENEKKEMFLTYVIIILILLSGLVIVLYLYYQIKQRNLKLAHRHKEILNQKQVTELLTDMELSNVKSKLEGQELERKRVAQELHDGIGGSLAGVKLNLIKISKTQYEEDEALQNVIDRMDVICEEVRTVSYDLIPPSFSDNTIIDLIEEFIPKHSRNGKTTFYYELYPKKEINALDVKLQVELYRIIQELIVNVRKHAIATEVNLSLILHDLYINLLVEDNGIGFDIHEKKHGIGLRNIRSRVEINGGQLSIDSQKGKGTSVNIDVPIT